MGPEGAENHEHHEKHPFSTFLAIKAMRCAAQKLIKLVDINSMGGTVIEDTLAIALQLHVSIPIMIPLCLFFPFHSINCSVVIDY